MQRSQRQRSTSDGAAPAHVAASWSCNHVQSTRAMQKKLPMGMGQLPSDFERTATCWLYICCFLVLLMVISAVGSSLSGFIKF